MDDTSNRRSLPRYACTGTVEMFQGGKLYGWGTVSEIGRGGCYIETGHPLSVGSELQLRLTMESAVLEIAAKVVWTTPQVGMGMHFEAASPEIEDAVVQVLSIVTGEGELAGMDSSPAEPEEFLLPESADPRTGIGQEGIRQEAAPEILAKIIERINRTGVLTEQELIEIVKASQ